MPYTADSVSILYNYDIETLSIGVPKPSVSKTNFAEDCSCHESRKDFKIGTRNYHNTMF